MLLAAIGHVANITISEELLTVNDIAYILLDNSTSRCIVIAYQFNAVEIIPLTDHNGISVGIGAICGVETCALLILNFTAILHHVITIKAAASLPTVLRV